MDLDYGPCQLIMSIAPPAVSILRDAGEAGIILTSASYATAEGLGTSYRPTAYRQVDNKGSLHDKDEKRRRLAGLSCGQCSYFELYLLGFAVYCYGRQDNAVSIHPCNWLLAKPNTALLRTG
jgi:hypothetical protein